MQDMFVNRVLSSVKDGYNEAGHLRTADVTLEDFAYYASLVRAPAPPFSCQCE